MPRRKNTDGDAATNNTGQPAKQPRMRKKKESSICSTPTGDHPIGTSGLKQESHMGMMLPIDGPGVHTMLGGLGPTGMHPHMQHPGLSNGMCGPIPGGPGPPQSMMDDSNNGPGGISNPFSTAPPQVHIILIIFSTQRI